MYMEIKLKTFADILQATKEVKIDEKATWEDASVATHDIMRDLKSKSWKISGISTNGFKVKHDNGCVGTVVFDPSLKESTDEIDEAKPIDKYKSKYGKSADISDVEDFSKTLSDKEKEEFFGDLVKHLGYESDMSKSEKDANKIKLLKSAIF